MSEYTLKQRVSENLTALVLKKEGLTPSQVTDWSAESDGDHVTIRWEGVSHMTHEEFNQLLQQAQEERWPF